MPKLSVITVNRNNAKDLEKTIKSVISQTFLDYEYIIIDGGSTDGSKEIIQKYADKITYWVSEPDKGIYNGMNKGLNVAKREYVNFLNSGDIFIIKDILKNIFSKNYSDDILYGNIKTEAKNFIFPEILSLKTFLKMPYREFKYCFYTKKGYKDGFLGLFLSFLGVWYSINAHINLYKYQKRNK